MVINHLALFFLCATIGITFLCSLSRTACAIALSIFNACTRFTSMWILGNPTQSLASPVFPQYCCVLLTSNPCALHRLANSRSPLAPFCLLFIGNDHHPSTYCSHRFKISFTNSNGICDLMLYRFIPFMFNLLNLIWFFISSLNSFKLILLPNFVGFLIG